MPVLPGKDQVTPVGDLQLRKIPVFQGDPFPEKTPVQFRAVSLQDAFALGRGIETEEDLQVIMGEKNRMEAVDPFDYIQGFRGDRDGLGEGLRVTVVDPVPERPASLQAPDHLVLKTEIIHIPTGLSQAGCCFEFRGKKEIIHMKKVTIVNGRQVSGQTGLSRPAVAIDTHQNLVFLGEQGINPGKERREAPGKIGFFLGGEIDVHLTVAPSFTGTVSLFIPAAVNRQTKVWLPSRAIRGSVFPEIA